MKKLLLSITAVFLFATSLVAQTWVAGGGPFGGNITDIVYHSASSKIFALAGNSVFVSPFGATLSWTYIPINAPNGDQVTDLYIDGSGNIFVLSSTALFKSTDAGVTFTQLNTSSFFSGGLKFGITSNNYVVLGIDGGPNNYKIWRSTLGSGGVTWSKAANFLGGNAYDMVVTNGNILVSEHTGQLMERSDNEGDNWAQKTNGTGGAQINSIAISANGAKVYCTTGSDVFESTDNGDNWVNQTLDLTSPISTANPAIISSADVSNLFFIDNLNHKLYKKAQATGGTWLPAVVASNFISSGFTGIPVANAAFKDGSNIFFGTRSFGVFKTANGGSTIAAANAGMGGMNYTNLVTASNGNLIVGSQAGLFLSTDQGANWSKPTSLAANINSNNFYVFKATTGSPNTIVAITGGFTSTSADNGVTWSTGATPVPNGMQGFSSSDGTVIYGFNSNQIVYSKDQGASWTPTPISVTGLGGYNINKLVIDQNKIAYAFQYNTPANIYKINLDSYTAPTTATAVNLAAFSTTGITSLNDIAYLNNKIYVMGNGSSGKIIGITADAGVSWAAKSAPSGNRLDVDPINNYLLVSSNGAINFSMSISRDDGNTYATSTINVNPTRTGIYGATIDPNGIAYAMLSNFGIYKTNATVVTPAAPSALTNSGAASDRITLRWTDNATSETYFVVQKFNGVSYDSVGTYATLSGTGKKGFVEIKNLSANTSYQFQVAAANSAGKSAYAQLTTSTTVFAASTFPDNVSWNGTVTGGNGATLTNIVIKALGSGNFSISDVNNGAVSGGSVTNIPGIFIESNGGVYLSPTSTGHLWSNTTGTWNGTNTLTFSWITDANLATQTVGTVTLTHTTDPAPAAPTNTTAYVYNSSGIEITWTGSAFETDYIIERSNSSFPTVDQTFNVSYPTTRYVDNTLLTLGSTYAYRVKAHNGGAPGNTSVPSNFTTVQLTKPYFTLTSIPNPTTLVSNTSSATTTGATWGDFNNDGFDDLIMPVLTGFSGTNSYPLMFKNNGAGDFTLVTSTSGLDQSQYIAATAADYDNDGNLDLFITSSGVQNYLYKGNGDFTFTKKVSPVTENVPNSFQTTSDLCGAWVDYDNDGLLDLYVVPNKNNYTGKLFKQGPAGTFTKITTGTLTTLAVNAAVTLWADYDNDGDQDVFVMDQNTGSPSQLLKNNGGGVFVAVAGPPFSTDLAAGSGGPQGAAWGDYDNDGFLDLYIGTTSNLPNILYKNNSGTSFTKTSFNTTITETKAANVVSSGVAWGDVNNDGFLDLVVANFGGSHQFYINNNGTAFTKISNEKLNDSKNNHFGASFSDYNNDGFLDIALSGVDITLFSGGSGVFGGVKSQLFKNNTTPGVSTNWVEFRLKGTTSNRSAIGARITLNASNSTHQIREVNSFTSFASETSQVVHFGLGANTISSVVIKWPSGIVMTLNNPTINQINNITEDGAAPVVSLLNPLNAATSVAVATPIELTFNEVPVPVASKKISVFVHGSASPAFSVNVTTGTVVGNKISFTPSPALNFLTQYDVVVDAGAFTDIYGNATVATINWSFTTIDNIPPTITFTPITSLTKGFTTTFSVTSTDNSGTVSSVDMFYRKVSTKAFADLPGTFNAATQKWDFSVLPTFFDETGMNYYFTAKDPSNNVAMLPALTTPQKYFIVLLKFTGTSAPALTIVKGTGNISGYQIISIPWEISNKDIASNFDELGGGDNTKYRFLRYHETPTPGWDEYPGTLSSFARGEGYFINQTVTNTITLLDGNSPKENRDSLFVMSLKKGWNEIGNPYLSAIQWNDVLAYNNIATGVGKLVLFGGTKYNPAADPGVLQPYLGGFVLADNAVAALKIPFQGQTSGGRSIQYDLTGEIADDSWQVNFQLKQNDLEFAMGSVGMSPNANAGKDIFDMAVPPRLSDEFIEMSVAHPEYFMKRLAGDVVNTQSDYAWEFNVSSNVNGIAELSWDNSKFGVNRKDLYLFDVALQKPIDMRQVNSYSFNPAESSKIKVIFGDDLENKVKPDRVLLGKAYPNPTSSVSVIPFTLPENSSNYQVRLEVYDMLGRKISTLADGEFKSGFYQSEWSTTDLNLANGLFTYRLVVSGGSSKEVQSGKILLKK